MNEELNKLTSIDDIEAYRKQINEACDKRLSEVKIQEKASELSAGSFSMIKESMENLSPLLFTSNEGIRLLNRYMAAVRETKELATLHTICESIRSMKNKNAVDYLVRKIVETKWGLDEGKTMEAISVIGKILAESYTLLGTEADELLANGDYKLDEAILFVASHENGANRKDLVKYANASQLIKESIDKSIEANSSNNLDTFYKKYENELSECDMKIINQLADGKEPAEIFETYRNDILEMLKNNTGNIEQSRLDKINEQITAKQFSEDTFSTDIVKLAEIHNILKQ